LGLSLKVVNVSKVFDGPMALQPQTWEIEPKEKVCVMGKSGSGKSTLLNILGLLDTPTSGHYWLNDVDTSKLTFKEKAEYRNTSIGFMFQFFHLLKGWSVVDNIALPLLYRGFSQDKSRLDAYAILEAMHLQDLSKRPVHTLSGGQKQRIALARALVIQPKLLLLDEPTAALDYENAHALMQMVVDLHRSFGFTLILVTHDPSMHIYCSRNIALKPHAIEVLPA
jgi:putative ABC transport system ATP-binding protein